MLKQTLSHKLLQKLSPQQIKLMKLIQLPMLELEQRIKQEIEENPALDDTNEVAEEDYDFEDYEDHDDYEINAEDINVDEYLSDDEIPSYRMVANNSSPDDEEVNMPLALGVSSIEMLQKQLDLRKLVDQEYLVASYLLGCIDDDGYIRRPLRSIVDDLAFTQGIMTSEEELSKMLLIIQDFEPNGIGARDLRECLLLQLKKKSRIPAVELAEKILESCFEEFTRKHYKKIMSRLEVKEEELKDATIEISRLNPKPGNTLHNSVKVIQHVIPDFTIAISDGELDLSLNSRNAPDLRVSKRYTEMLEAYKDHKTTAKKAEKEAILFVKQKLDSAKWFIDAIKQRQNTLYVTMGSIMEYQKEYFLTGDERKLKPMILKDIADLVGMDISTVSRVANSKYVSTPYGTFLIKSFFSESMKNDEGEDVSTKEIKNILNELILDENKKKPLTDDKLAQLLKEKGYPIARRTIAKYREQLNIPVARLRKEL